MQQKMRTLVAGVGPAGWLAAVALAEQGADVTLVGDAPDAGWPARYGAWCHTLPDEVFDRRWPSVRVQLDDQRVHTLPVPYGRVSGEALQRSLRRRFAAVEEVGGDLFGLKVGKGFRRARARRDLPAVGFQFRGQRGGAVAHAKNEHVRHLIRPPLLPAPARAIQR